MHDEIENQENINENNDEEVIIYLGKPVHDNDNSVDPVAFDEKSFSRINTLFQNIPHFFNYMRLHDEVKDTYRVYFDKGLGHLQQSAKDRNLVKGNIVAYGTNNDIKGQADWGKSGIKIGITPLLAFQIASVVTSQYFLARIDKKLSLIDSKLDHIIAFLEEDKKAQMVGDRNFLRSVSNEFDYIIQDETLRQSKLNSIQDVLRNALHNKSFYKNRILNNFEIIKKGAPLSNDLIRQILDDSDAYWFAVSLYVSAKVLETMLSLKTDEDDINKLKKDIIDFAQGKPLVDGQVLLQYLEADKSKKPKPFTEILSGYHFGRYSLSNSQEANLINAMIGFAGLAAKDHVDKKKQQKSEVKYLIDEYRSRTEKNIREFDNILQSFDDLNALYNHPVELIISNDTAYINVLCDNDDKKE